MCDFSAAGMALAEQAVGRYDLPLHATVRLVSVSENEIYQVAAPSGQRWALRLQRPGYQSPQSLRSEISWLVALREAGVVATPVPHAGLDGSWVQTVIDPATGEMRRVVLFAWEPGSHPIIEMDLRPCFQTLGAVIAGMHAHSRAWRRPAGFERFSWDFDTALGESARWGRWRDGPGMNTAYEKVLSRGVALVGERLAAYGSGPDRFGLVHGDLRLQNLLLHEGAVKVIDFDDCGFSWYMADLANCVSFYEHLPQVPALLAALLEGYRSVHPLSQAEVEELPTFLLLRRLSLLAWTGSHAETAMAASLGPHFTVQTVDLCARYLKTFA
jgi:Ser/Thr protein kinase RdoA (MazF antagonist)